MARLFFTFLIAFVLLGPSSASAMGDKFELNCPKDVKPEKADKSAKPTKSAKDGKVVAPLPPGWLFSAPATDLPETNGITLYDGPPGEMSTLVPNNEPLKKEGEKHFWKFKTLKKKQVWVQCSYAKEEKRYMRPLPEKVKKCTKILEHTLLCE